MRKSILLLSLVLFSCINVAVAQKNSSKSRSKTKVIERPEIVYDTIYFDENAE